MACVTLTVSETESSTAPHKKVQPELAPWLHFKDICFLYTPTIDIEPEKIAPEVVVNFGSKMLQDNTNQSAGTFVNNTLQRLSQFGSRIPRHTLQLGAQILSHKVMERFSENIRLPDF